MIVKATWEFDVDTSELLDEFVDVEGLAKDLTKRELEYLLTKCKISADEFIYEVIDNTK